MSQPASAPLHPSFAGDLARILRMRQDAGELHAVCDASGGGGSTEGGGGGAAIHPSLAGDLRHIADTAARADCGAADPPPVAPHWTELDQRVGVLEATFTPAAAAAWDKKSPWGVSPDASTLSFAGDVTVAGTVEAGALVVGAAPVAVTDTTYTAGTNLVLTGGDATTFDLAQLVTGPNKWRAAPLEDDYVASAVRWNAYEAPITSNTSRIAGAETAIAALPGSLPWQPGAAGALEYTGNVRVAGTLDATNFTLDSQPLSTITSANEFKIQTLEFEVASLTATVQNLSCRLVYLEGVVNTLTGHTDDAPCSS